MSFTLSELIKKKCGMDSSSFLEHFTETRDGALNNTRKMGNFSEKSWGSMILVNC